MKKWVIGLIIIAALVFGGYYMFVGPKPGIVLESVNGEVFVNDLPAKVGMNLKQTDTIVTKAGTAAVSLYEGSIIRLAENTELELVTKTAKELNFNQLAGRTWSKVVKLSGIEEYSIQTPDAVATVRGTAFDVEVLEDGTEVATAEGIVDVKSGSERIQVEKDKAVRARQKKLERIEAKLDKWRENNVNKDVEHIKRLKGKIRKKYKRMIKIAREKGATDEQIADAIEDHIRGELKVADLLAKKDRLREFKETTAEETDEIIRTAEEVQALEDDLSKIDGEQARIEEAVDGVLSQESEERAIVPPAIDDRTYKDIAEEPAEKSQDSIEEETFIQDSTGRTEERIILERTQDRITDEKTSDETFTK